MGDRLYEAQIDEYNKMERVKDLMEDTILNKDLSNIEERYVTGMKTKYVFNNESKLGI